MMLNLHVFGFQPECLVSSLNSPRGWRGDGKNFHVSSKKSHNFHVSSKKSHVFHHAKHLAPGEVRWREDNGGDTLGDPSAWQCHKVGCLWGPVKDANVVEPCCGPKYQL